MIERVLITGCGGFAGRWLRLMLATRLPSGSALDAGDMRTGTEAGGDGRVDVTDAAAVAAWVRDFAPTAIVHLAAVASPRDAKKRPEYAWTVNVMGTVNVCEAMRRYAPQSRLVFISSSEVYGTAFLDQSDPVDEEARPRPLSTYGATKMAAEIAVLQYAREGMRVAVLRPFNHTGPGQATDYVIPAFAAQIAEIEFGLRPPRMNVGNLDACREMLDVRDVTEAYALACLAEAPPPPPGIVNIASGKAHRIGDLLDRLLAMARVKIEVVTDSALLRPNDVPVTAGSTHRASRWLGWSPRHSIDDTLIAVLNDCRARVEAG